MFPFYLNQRTMFFPYLFKRPLTRYFYDVIYRHSDQAIAYTPSLIKRSRQEDQTKGNVSVQVTIVYVCNFKQDASFTRNLSMRYPVLVPHRFCFDRGRQASHGISGQDFVYLVRQFFVNTARFRYATQGNSRFRYGNHAQGLFHVVNGEYSEYHHLRVGTNVGDDHNNSKGAYWFTIFVVQVVISNIRITTSALWVRFLFIFIVVGIDDGTILIGPFQRRILVTFLTKFIQGVFSNVFRFQLNIPIRVHAIFYRRKPCIFRSRFNFDHVVVPNIILEQGIADRTVYFGTTSIVCIFKRLPTIFHVQVSVTRRAEFVKERVSKYFVCNGRGTYPRGWSSRGGRNFSFRGSPFFKEVTVEVIIDDRLFL